MHGENSRPIKNARRKQQINQKCTAKTADQSNLKVKPSTVSDGHA
jgi:hypothetical protein